MASLVDVGLVFARSRALETVGHALWELGLLHVVHGRGLGLRNSLFWIGRVDDCA